MGSHEIYSSESEWYTPLYIFQALGCRFQTDVAAPSDHGLTHVPADSFISCNSLQREWSGFVWCNPPWAGRGQKQPWIDKIHLHNNGLLLTPDRTSAPWWQDAAKKADGVIFVLGKIKFIPGPGNSQNFNQPGNGTVIFAWGEVGMNALRNAEKQGLGLLMRRCT